MINVPTYDKKDRRSNVEMLPKGAYVCKILHIELKDSKKGHPMVVVNFDIAEGEFKDFYMKQFQADDREDKHWNYDAITYLTIPYDGCEPFITTNWATFWANVEDSNNGYVFTGDEQTVIGKTFGGVFRIEETEAPGGKIYEHTRLSYTRIAQDIREGKVKKLPADKRIQPTTAEATAEGFMPVGNSPEDLPWKKH